MGTTKRLLGIGWVDGALDNCDFGGAVGLVAGIPSMRSVFHA